MNMVKLSVREAFLAIVKKRGERFQSAFDLAFAIESVSRESGPAPANRATEKPRARTVVAVAVALFVAIAAYWLGRAGGAPILSYERLTFRRGTVYTGAVRSRGART